MGYAELELALPTDFSQEFLAKRIASEISTKSFKFQILKRSLDARNKRDIHYLVRVGVTSDTLGGEAPATESLELPPQSTGKGRKVVVVGCGPAGIFASAILARAGFSVTIIEKGSEVERRTDEIKNLEATGTFSPLGSYCFGAGGAGTFSDGKLTSRTKTISKERAFIFNEFIKAGAPAEIAFDAFPHVGSDNLKKVIPAMLEALRETGVTTLFETEVCRLEQSFGRLTSLELSGRHAGKIEADYFIFAFGNNSLDFYKLLISQGISFTTKPFAIGFRVEHEREEINLSQWGRRELKGVKAAEYRLTAKLGTGYAFTFCMCPGGRVVQTAPASNLSVVNGMSNYLRDGRFSNSAVVTPFRFEELEKGEVSPLRAIELLEDIEQKFYSFSGSFAVPTATISSLLRGKPTAKPTDSSFPFGLIPADYSELLPSSVLHRLTGGLRAFSRQLKCFENGIALGFESKTSAPLQSLRNDDFSTPPYSNLYLCGEGSGHSGGIVSSAADGIKTALMLAKKC